MPQYVYVLQNLAQDRIYIGCADNLDRRLIQHNQGESIYTKDKSPFRIVWYCCFDDEKRAFLFEKYLKGGSGRAFIRKQILP